MRNPFTRKPKPATVTANEMDLHGQVKYIEGYFAGYMEANKTAQPQQPQPQLPQEPEYELHTGFYL